MHKTICIIESEGEEPLSAQELEDWLNVDQIGKTFTVTEFTPVDKKRLLGIDLIAEAAKRLNPLSPPLPDGLISPKEAARRIRELETEGAGIALRIELYLPLIEKK